MEIEMKIGQTGIITHVTDQRLLELGLLGERVTVFQTGRTCIIQAGGCKICLRSETVKIRITAPRGHH